MFFVTYLRRELSCRMRQAVIVALGLAVGVGLVVTVSAASAGVARAESGVLGALYGVGTDVTVTGAVVGSAKPREASPGQSVVVPPPGSGPRTEIGPHGPQTCTGGRCVNAAGTTQQDLASTYLGIGASKVAQAARLPGVAAADGGIMLLDQTVTFPKNGSGLGQPGGYTVYGWTSRIRCSARWAPRRSPPGTRSPRPMRTQTSRSWTPGTRSPRAWRWARRSPSAR